MYIEKNKSRYIRCRAFVFGNGLKIPHQVKEENDNIYTCDIDLAGIVAIQYMTRHEIM
jgi:mannitol/fructose-specific phosphotransferase system IIA component